MTTNLRWVGAAVSLVMIAGASSCSGEPFCEDTRTCSGAAAPIGGGDSDNGGAPSSTAGSSNGGARDVIAGNGNGGSGEAGTPSTVGNDCNANDECDDKDSCTGVETCVQGTCIAGKAVECPTGLMCSAEKDGACVFKTDAPWILYQESDDHNSISDVYAIKADLVGVMDPVRVNPDIKGLLVRDAGWLPNGAGAYVILGDPDFTKSDLYWIPFGDGLPGEPQQVTKDLPASGYTDVTITSDSKLLVIGRDDGLYPFDVTPESITSGGETPVGSGPYGTDQAFFFSTNKLIWLRDNAPIESADIFVSTRSGKTWTEASLVSDLVVPIEAGPNPDGSLLFYVTEDANQLKTLWALETTSGSKPVKVVGPVSDCGLTFSPDGNRVLLATSDTIGVTTIRGGAAAFLTSLPTLKQNVTIFASDALAIPSWSPNSSRAAVFDGVMDAMDREHRTFAVYDPAAAEPWHKVLNLVQKYDDPSPQWTSDSMSLAAVWRQPGPGLATLSFVTLPKYTQRGVDQAKDANGVIQPYGFSAGDKYFAYTKAAAAATLGEAYYTDLSEGVQRSFDPVLIAKDVRNLGFGPRGTGLLYQTKTDCFYFDPATDADADPMKLNDSAFSLRCQFQPLPPK